MSSPYRPENEPELLPEAASAPSTVHPGAPRLDDAQSPTADLAANPTRRAELDARDERAGDRERDRDLRDRREESRPAPSERRDPDPDRRERARDLDSRTSPQDRDRRRWEEDRDARQRSSSPTTPRTAGSHDAPATEAKLTRRLQMLTVVVGFLFFLALLIELLLMAMGTEHGTLTADGTSTGATGWAETLRVIALGGVLILAPLTMLFAGSCLGRYRALAKLAAILLFLGAAVRMGWTFLLEAAERTGVLSSGTLLGNQVLETTGPALAQGDLRLAAWGVLVGSLVATLIGLLGLIAIRPKAPRVR